MIFQSNCPQMVDFSDVTIPIPVKQVLRRLGYPPGVNRVEGDMRLLVQKAFDMAPDLIVPKAVFRILDVQNQSGDRVIFQNHTICIENDKVARLLRHSSKVVFFMVTIGSSLEKALQSLLEHGDVTEGAALDAIGSETADAVADYVHHVAISNLASQNSYKITPRFSPGYGEWALTIQRDILDLCEGHRIGISLTGSCLMQPRKSVSAVFGLEADLSNWE